MEKQEARNQSNSPDKSFPWPMTNIQRNPIRTRLPTSRRKAYETFRAPINQARSSLADAHARIYRGLKYTSTKVKTKIGRKIKRRIKTHVEWQRERSFEGGRVEGREEEEEEDNEGEEGGGLRTRGRGSQKQACRLQRNGTRRNEPACDIRDTRPAFLPRTPFESRKKKREKDRKREIESSPSRASWCTPLLPSRLIPFQRSLLTTSTTTTTTTTKYGFGPVRPSALPYRIVDFSQRGQKDSLGTNSTVPIQSTCAGCWPVRGKCRSKGRRKRPIKRPRQRIQEFQRV